MEDDERNTTKGTHLSILGSKVNVILTFSATLSCYAITQTVFIPHTQMEDNKRKIPIDFGVKSQGHTDIFCHTLL